MTSSCWSFTYEYIQAEQRGDEAIPDFGTTGAIDVRLSLLGTFEGLIRQGSADWECGRFISGACEGIIADIVLPNLVWRVGRVEATVRKVVLASCYGLVKAGAVQGEALFKSAPRLV